ncbi:MAG: arginine--tRNA ligase [Lentimicrobiaceae bacterium]|nr:arginine--tRNA ligase [Lentimicrobiaceae bacterium]
MIEQKIAQAVADAVMQNYGKEILPSAIQIQKTNPEFVGDLTVVIFPLLGISRKSPEITGNQIGKFLLSSISEISSFQVVKGFLNLCLTDEFFIEVLKSTEDICHFGFTQPGNEAPVVVEFSSPNTNKPLHLGHIRNNLLGNAVSQILKASGKNVVKVNLVNDRGIHICKSMLAWKLWGNGETPESSGIKGDHLVGKYYVLFDKKFKEEVKSYVIQGMPEEEAEKRSTLMQQARQLLVKWENHDSETIALWKSMNAWVYEGFDVTYRRMGISFDKTYHESETYLLGKKIVEKGLGEGLLVRNKDGSVWADLTSEGLDEKLLLRSDGTSVYITQDLGTAHLRYGEYYPQQLIYVVGNEQNYHFDVLKAVLKKLGYSWSEKLHHLNYGMVELPHGKMKSREGTVVDADDLMDTMTDTARKTTEALGKAEEASPEDLELLYQKVGMAALKYFILKVDPKKNMLFNPEESIDFNGNTGPFIQYTHARIRSLLRKAGADNNPEQIAYTGIQLHKNEKAVLDALRNFPEIVQQAADMLSPALIANYIFDLAKTYNAFYQEVPVMKEENAVLKHFRLHLSFFTASVIKNGMSLLGIDVPEKM